ncbi:hypothetical protein FF098_014700 [Parvularcula flava]|uniref:Uncharacterized protein n=1 Tax=Aquisalinus luteolus TaxID=1566827 RepID=A0A8J3A3S6_9PROT|nr:hypothetical protein [Aquisalinus luteolus]NHK29167.1 hypothetical protein [Aquisalinus luteolus]GGI00101.1 hypothetical protein GCM10011355_27600 [Aquisalinus luteolus]
MTYEDQTKEGSEEAAAFLTGLLVGAFSFAVLAKAFDLFVTVVPAMLPG